jgi:hypothetical protein
MFQERAHCRAGMAPLRAVSHSPAAQHSRFTSPSVLLRSLSGPRRTVAHPAPLRRPPGPIPPATRSESPPHPQTLTRRLVRMIVNNLRDAAALHREKLWSVEVLPSPPHAGLGRSDGLSADRLSSLTVWCAPLICVGVHYAYNAALNRATGGKGRAEMTLAELEAAVEWLGRNRLRDHLHLLEHDYRFGWRARPRSEWRPPTGRPDGSRGALQKRWRRHTDRGGRQPGLLASGWTWRPADARPAGSPQGILPARVCLARPVAPPKATWPASVRCYTR